MARKRPQGLLEFPPEWEADWEGMPEFVARNETAQSRIVVQFRTPEDRRAFLRFLGEKPDREKSIWWPQVGYERQSERDAPPASVGPGRFPVYVISKGRWDTLLTVKALERLGLPHFLVVEPQEERRYERAVRGMRCPSVRVLPFSNLGLGSIPARNWVWEDSLGNGDARHWILDDNLDGFYRFNRNRKEKVVRENPLTAAEELAERYTNVALAGLNYEFFVLRRAEYPPFYLNTRVYSCILVNNVVPYRWRGRYNEDTDLALCALKGGWCTILLNAYLAKKMPTMTMTGGNSDELYAGDDGRLLMAESLREQHPDVVSVTRKWGRWQHHVDYRRFKRNKLKPVQKAGKEKR
jgi:hypothetical protein